MVIAGGVGARIDLRQAPASRPGLGDVEAAFSEGLTRFLLEVDPRHAAELERRFAGLPFATVGDTLAEPVLEAVGAGGRVAVRAGAGELEAAWRFPLTRVLEGT
jgi:phosphoribosylformylglycinamidine (FGAM) synthase-like enzyme